MGPHEPYEQGFVAFAAGVSLDACPFPENSPERHAWELGWNYGERALTRRDENEDRQEPEKLAQKNGSP